MKIVVLAGGLSPERNVSLSSGCKVCAALRERGHETALIDMYLGTGEEPAALFAAPIPEELTRIGRQAPDLESVKASRTEGAASQFGPGVLDLCGMADVVFLGLHGACGEDGRVQAALDLLGIPYTGAGHLGSAIAMDKDLTKRVAAPLGVRTPKWELVKYTAEDIPALSARLALVDSGQLSLDLEAPAAANFIGEARWQALRDEVELLGAGREFDMKAVRAGTLSPVFFGSALTNFGVEPFLEEFLRMTTPPLNRDSDSGEIDAFSPEFSAFVFKIQANMNKAHRDRIAFMRVCSGKFQRDSEVYHMQSGKKLRLSQPQQMLAAEREIIDEAYAGDIIGVFDPGLFSIGDTVTAPSKKFKFQGIPTFEPEHFMRVSPMDTMKRKQFIKGTEQIAQEGAIQIFKIPFAGMEEVIVGVVGTLQFDVFQYRMRSEYGVELRMAGLPYDHLRRIAASPVEPKDLTLCADAALLEDFRGRSLIAYSGEWPVGYLLKHNPGLELEEPN